MRCSNRRHAHYSRLFGLAGVTLLALGVRLFGLSNQSVWFDEAVSVGLGALPVPDMVKASTADVNPPLYYLLLHVWLPLATDDAWLRLPSACAAQPLLA